MVYERSPPPRASFSVETTVYVQCTLYPHSPSGVIKDYHCNIIVIDKWVYKNCKLNRTKICSPPPPLTSEKNYVSKLCNSH